MADLGISISLDSSQYSAQLRSITQQTQIAAKQLSDAIGSVAAANQNLVKSGDSLGALNDRYKKLNDEIKLLSPNSDAFIQKAAELRTVGQRIDSIQTSIHGVNEELKKPTKGFFDGLSQGFGAITAVSIGSLVADGIKSITGAMIDLGKESIQVASDVQTVNRALAFTAGSAEEGAASYDRFKDVANGLGISIEKNQRAFKNFVVSATQSGQTLGQAETEFRQVAAAITAMGLSAEDSNGVLLALGQIASKGTVQAEELRGQIGERLPGAFAIAARSIGVTESKLNDMLKQGEVVSKDFLPKFTQELERTFGSTAQEGVNSYSAQLNRFNNKLFELKVTIGEALIPAANNLFAIFTKTGEALGLIAKESAKSSAQISDGLILQKEKLQDLVFAITNANKGEEVRKELISQLNAEYPTFLKGLNAETASNEELFQRLDKVNDAYDKKIRLQVAQESLAGIEKELKTLETQRFELLKAESALLRQSASLKKETGFVSAAQLKSQNSLQENANKFTQNATAYTKDQITQKKLELSYQEELVKEYLKSSSGVSELLGLSGKQISATQELSKEQQKAAEKAAKLAEKERKAAEKELEKLQKAAEKLGEFGSLTWLEDNLKNINEQLRKLGGINIDKNSVKLNALLGRKEDIESQILSLKKLLGIIDEVAKKINVVKSKGTIVPQIGAFQSPFGAFAPDTQIQTAQATPFDVAEFDAINEAILSSDGAVRGLERSLSELGQTFGATQDKAATFAAQLVEDLKSIKDNAFQSLGDGLANVAQTFGNSIGQLITGVTTFEEVMKSTLLSLGQAILVELPKVVGMGLVQSAFSPAGILSFPANIPLALAGLALIGASGLIGGILSGIGSNNNDTIAAQTASAGQIGGTGTTAQATAQGLGSNSAANTQAVTNVTVVLNTNGILTALEKQQYINGLLTGG